MKSPSSLLARVVAAGCVLFGTLPFAAAQDYPQRPITIVVASAPGGPGDTAARVISDRMGAILGGQIIIETVPGGGGTTGTARVARAEPDGYTLLVHQTGITISPALYPKLSYDVEKDLVTVGMVNTSYSFLVGRKTLPPNTLEELVGWMKGPGKPVKFAFPGVGSQGHLSTVLFAQAVGTEVNAVPYRGVGPAMNDIVGGHVDLVFAGAATALPLIKDGLIKAYGFTGPQPSPLLPQIPSVQPPGYLEDIPFWHALFAPAATPKPIVAKLNAALRQTLEDPRVKKAYAETGVEVFSPERMTVEGANAFVRGEIQRWGKVVRENSIQPEQ